MIRPRGGKQIRRDQVPEVPGWRFGEVILFDGNIATIRVFRIARECGPDDKLFDPQHFATSTGKNKLGSQMQPS
jgi:hypothetical protein